LAEAFGLGSVTMLVLLVRHAESSNNALMQRLREEGHATLKGEYERQKSSDPHLSELGESQARRCGEWIETYLQSMGFLPQGYRVELVSSPMERALRTAAALASALEGRVEVWTDVHETKGCWNGKETLPGRGASELLAAVGADIFWNSDTTPVAEAGWWTHSGRTKDKETEAQSCDRARVVAARLRSQALAADFPTVKVIVTHGNWMSLLLQALLFPAGDMQIPLIKHDNTAMTAIVLPGTGGGCPALVNLNRSEHLDAEPAITRTRQNIALTGFGPDGRRQRRAATEESPLSSTTTFCAAMAVVSTLLVFARLKRFKPT
jgi:broad specificity phosphatase PhoE